MEGMIEKKMSKFDDIHESNHALKIFIESNRNGDRINTSALPWLLMEQKSDILKEVIKK